ncbi:unnamed protein product [Trichobilharzia regenti]|nr:unnamed protein product [Trichobilharzia regenti]
METERSDRLLQEKAKKQLTKDLKPIEKLRYQCLSRGASGIAGISRQFRIIDDDGNKKLDFREFSKGCRDFGVDLTKDEIKEIFDEIDTDQSGFIDFDEFLVSLRIEDLKGTYNVKHHPKYINGEKTEDEILVEFLKTFQPQQNADEVVSSYHSRNLFISYFNHPHIDAFNFDRTTCDYCQNCTFSNC